MMFMQAALRRGLPAILCASLCMGVLPAGALAAGGSGPRQAGAGDEVPGRTWSLGDGADGSWKGALEAGLPSRKRLLAARAGSGGASGDVVHFYAGVAGYTDNSSADGVNLCCYAAVADNPGVHYPVDGRFVVETKDPGSDKAVERVNRACAYSGDGAVVIDQEAVHWVPDLSGVDHEPEAYAEGHFDMGSQEYVVEVRGQSPVLTVGIQSYLDYWDHATGEERTVLYGTSSPDGSSHWQEVYYVDAIEHAWYAVDDDPSDHDLDLSAPHGDLDASSLYDEAFLSERTAGKKKVTGVSIVDGESGARFDVEQEDIQPGVYSALDDEVRFTQADGGKYFHMAYITHSGAQGTAVVKIPDARRIVYDARGGTEVPSVDAGGRVWDGGSLPVTDAVPSRDGFRFLGWAEDPDGVPAHTYRAGDMVRLSGGDVVLYAVWQELHSITGSVVNGTISGLSQEVPDGSSVTVSYAPDDGCQLQSLRVDGVDMDITRYQSGYTFTDVRQGHRIDVVFGKPSALSVMKSADKASVEPGDTVTYTLDVSQGGTGDAFGVTVRDEIPEGLSAIGGVEARLVRAGLPDEALTVSRGDGYWEVSGVRIPSGAHVLASYSCKVDGKRIPVLGALGGTVLASAADGGTASAQAQVDYLGYPVSVTKSGEGSCTSSLSRAVYGAQAVFSFQAAPGWQVRSYGADGSLVRDIPGRKAAFSCAYTVGDGALAFHAEFEKAPEVSLSMFADRESVRPGEAVHYTVEARQAVEGAYAYGFVLSGIIPEGLRLLGDVSAAHVSSDGGRQAVQVWREGDAPGAGWFDVPDGAAYWCAGLDASLGEDGGPPGALAYGDVLRVEFDAAVQDNAHGGILCAVSACPAKEGHVSAFPAGWLRSVSAAVSVSGYRVTVSAVNGTITGGAEGLAPGSSTEVAYAPDGGYILESVTVDGEALSGEELGRHQDGYVFTDIRSDHSVEVVYRPRPVLKVEKSCGTESLKPLGTAQYTVKAYVGNEGAYANGVSVKDVLPYGMMFAKGVSMGVYRADGRLKANPDVSVGYPDYPEAPGEPKSIAEVSLSYGGDLQYGEYIEAVYEAQNIGEVFGALPNVATAYSQDAASPFSAEACVEARGWDIRTSAVNGTVTESILDIPHRIENAQLVTYAPYPGYVLESVTVDGVAYTGDGLHGMESSYLFEYIQEDHSIDVVFAKERGAGGCTASMSVGPQSLRPGGLLTYTLDILPDAGGLSGPLSALLFLPEGASMYGEPEAVLHTGDGREALALAREGDTLSLIYAGGLPEGSRLSIRVPMLADAGHVGELTCRGVVESGAGSRSVSASAAVRGWDVSTSVDGDGSISESLSGIRGGSSCTVSWRPADGWMARSVTVDGAEVDVSECDGQYTFHGISGDHAVHVSFVRRPGLSVSLLAGQDTVAPGESVMLTASCSQTVEGASAPGAVLRGTLPEGFSLKGAVDVYLVHGDGQREALGGGSVDGDSWSYAYGGALLYGERLEAVFEASAQDGAYGRAVASAWASSPDVPQEAHAEASLTVSGYPITVSAEHGSITGGGDARPGSDAAVSWQADGGYLLESVTIDGEGVDIRDCPDGYVFRDVRGPHTVEVSFRRAPSLSASLSVEPDVLRPGEASVFTLEVTQAHADAYSEGISVCEALPEGLELAGDVEAEVSGVPVGVSVGGGCWSLSFPGRLGYGQVLRAVYTVRASGLVLGDIQDGIAVKAADAGGAEGSCTVHVEGWKVATEAEHGSATPGRGDIPQGGAFEVSYAADEGYALGYIEVDGERMDAGNGVYAFTDIRSDHTFRVVCVKAPGLSVRLSAGQAEVKPDGRILFTAEAVQACEGASSGPVLLTCTLPAGLRLDGDPEASAGTVEVSGSGWALSLPGGLSFPEGGEAGAVRVQFACVPDGKAYGPAEVSVSAGGDAGESSQRILLRGWDVAASASGGQVSGGLTDIPDGGSFRVSYTADEGYVLSSLTVDGVGVDIMQHPDSYLFGDVHGDHVLHAEFAPAGDASYSIHVSAENGMVDGMAEGIAPGEDAFLWFVPDSGYMLGGITVDGEDVDISDYPDSYTFHDVQCDHSIHVVFVPARYYRITAEAEHGSIRGAAKGVIEGGMVRVTYSPEEGYRLGSISIDGEPVDTVGHESMYVFGDIRADHHIRVVFVPDVPEGPFTVSVYSENGSVEGAGESAAGKDVTLRFIPDRGFVLSRLVVDGEELDAAAYADGYTFTDLRSGHTVEAYFMPLETYRITAEAEHGSIRGAAKGVWPGGTVRVTYSPEEGYRLGSISIDGEPVDTVGHESMYVFGGIYASHHIRVVFVPDAAYDVTATAEHGTITGGGAGIPAGSDVEVSYVPDEGYHLERLVVDGREEDILRHPSSYVFYGVGQGHSIHAVFAKDVYYAISTDAVGGSVTGSLSGIRPGSDAEVRYTPAEGYVLDYLEADGERVAGDASGVYVFTDVRSDHTFLAVFRKAFCVSVSVYGGTITGGILDAAEGSDVEVRFSPDPGHVLSAVIIDGVQMDPDAMAAAYGDGRGECIYMFRGVASPHSIHVEYREGPQAQAGLVLSVSLGVPANEDMDFLFHISGPGVDLYRAVQVGAGASSARVSLGVPDGLYAVRLADASGWSAAPGQALQEVHAGEGGTAAYMLSPDGLYAGYAGHGLAVNELK